MENITQTKRIGIDDWACDQEIEYTLVAKVNGEVACRISSADLDVIESQLIHAEEEVAKLMNDQYIDATMPPEYWSNEDDIYNV